MYELAIVLSPRWEGTAPHAHAWAGRHHAARDRQSPQGQEATAGLAGSDPALDRTQSDEVTPDCRLAPAEIARKCLPTSAECKPRLELRRRSQPHPYRPRPGKH